MAMGTAGGRKVKQSLRRDIGGGADLGGKGEGGAGLDGEGNVGLSGGEVAGWN